MLIRCVVGFGTTFPRDIREPRIQQWVLFVSFQNSDVDGVLKDDSDGNDARGVVAFGSHQFDA